MKAKGLFGLLSTHRDGWQVTVAELVRRGREGVDSVTTGLKQLEQYGFLHRIRERSPDGTLGQALCVITAVTVLALIAAILATLHGIPLSVAVPAAALARLLTERLPDVLDARAGERACIVAAGPACRYLHRLATLYAVLTDAAARSDHDRIRRALQIGHHQLFDTACLLQHRDTRSVSAQLISRERLTLQLAAQTAGILTPTAMPTPMPTGGDASPACPGRPGQTTGRPHRAHAVPPALS
ncbi:hypothetical protein ACFYVC_38550 [Streptomyces tendae]|uniref:hypothetical protein n=1 Tax=Streptomyces tendae TaxID=1932 RepID=UPI0036D0F2D0